jgi:hypothetical protein
MFSREVGKGKKYALDGERNAAPFFNNLLKAKMNLNGFLNPNHPRCFGDRFVGEDLVF